MGSSGKLSAAFDQAIEATKPPPKCRLCKLPPAVRAEMDRRLRETKITAHAVSVALERLGHPGFQLPAIRKHRNEAHWEKA